MKILTFLQNLENTLKTLIIGSKTVIIEKSEHFQENIRSSTQKYSTNGALPGGLTHHQGRTI